MQRVVSLCVYKLDGSYLQITESDCSDSELGCNCLETDCFPSGNHCNHFVIEKYRPEVEHATPLTSGQPITIVICNCESEKI